MDKLRLKLKAYDHRILDEAVKKIIEQARLTGSVVKGPIPLPVRRRRWCVLRSPHKFDQSREHFEIREYARIVELHKVTPQTMESLQNLVLPAGVDINIISEVG